MRTVTVIVDQSIKVENTREDTVLAFSHPKKDTERLCDAIVIPRSHKRKLRPIGKSVCRSPKAYRLKLFSAGVYLLTMDSVDLLGEIIIDKEYENNGGEIKGHLTNYFLQHKGISKENMPVITFDYVHSYGSPPGCHKIAKEVKKGNREPRMRAEFGYLKNLVIPSN